MNEEYDLTRSKKPMVVPDENDLAQQHLEIDRLGRLLQDADLLEELMRGNQHEALVEISKQRIFEIVRNMLKVSLTPSPVDVAFHNDAQGRLRERLMILEQLEGVVAGKGWLARKRESLERSVQRWSERREAKKRKE